MLLSPFKTDIASGRGDSADRLAFNSGIVKHNFSKRKARCCRPESRTGAVPRSSVLAQRTCVRFYTVSVVYSSHPLAVHKVWVPWQSPNIERGEAILDRTNRRPGCRVPSEDTPQVTAFPAFR